MTLDEQLLRLGSAVLGGTVLGLNRKVGGKAAGMRTHALVSLGAAVSVLAAELLVQGTPDTDRGAATRVMQGVISGIGFLGAGAIIKGAERGIVKGLTTAASIWLAAAVGLASGAGFWQTALLATALGLLVLIAGRYVERATRHLLVHELTEEERRLLADRRAGRDSPEDSSV
jgi:putative Mg2+ transporter-C (MgtC) family protein